MTKLQKAHAVFGNGTPFVPNHYTGTGNIRFMYDKGRNGRFFRWLRNLIETELQQTPQGKIYVFVATFSRLFRPSEFSRHDPTTWAFTDADCKMLADWLTACFGDRAKDIVFVTLHSDTPESDHGYLTAIGMHHRGNMGGKPPKVKKTRINKIMREYLRMLTVHLLEKGRSVQQIRQNFVKWGASVTERAVQKWAKAAGFARPPGKPRTIVKP